MRGSGCGHPEPRIQPAESCGREAPGEGRRRSEEHTSELQSRLHLVCRLLLEKKKNHQHHPDRGICNRQSQGQPASDLCCVDVGALNVCCRHARIVSAAVFMTSDGMAV